MRDTKFFIIAILFLALLLPNFPFLSAADYSSAHFILRDPVITVEGGMATSTSFEYFSSSGQTISGESTSTSFIHKAGFLYFPSAAVCGNNVKETGEQCDGTDLSGASCTTSGYFAGTLGCSASCERTVNSCIATAPQASTTVPVSSSSGGEAVLTSTNNATVVFDLPPNFYTENLTLEANSYAPTFFALEKPVPSGKNVVGKTYDFSFVIPAGAQAGTQISTVLTPVPITISYLDSDVSGLDESAIAPYRWGANDSSWQLISGATVDTAHNKVTFSTTHFSSFALFVNSSPAPSSGGATTGSLVVSNSVIFPGRAYPNSIIVLLKDAEIAATAVADKNANFELTLAGLSRGDYLFSLYSKDYTGKLSKSHLFPMRVEDVTVKVRDIVIAPTLSVDKREAVKGESISLFGQSLPNADMTIFLKSKQGEISFHTLSDKDGKYLYLLDTSTLESGGYQGASRAFLGKIFLTPMSPFANFVIGDRTIPQESQVFPPRGDINGDHFVNLVDFSILLYWFGRPSVPPEVDFDSNGKVDLFDFSIMVFHWTG